MEINVEDMGNNDLRREHEDLNNTQLELLTQKCRYESVMKQPAIYKG